MAVPLVPFLVEAAGRGARVGVQVLGWSTGPARRALGLGRAEAPTAGARPLLGPEPRSAPEPSAASAAPAPPAAPEPPAVRSPPAVPPRPSSSRPAAAWSLQDAVRMVRQGYAIDVVSARTGWSERELQVALRRQ